jgi:hypothetical protein
MIWKPHRDLTPQYAHLPDNDKIGGIITHEMPNGTICKGAILFDCPQTREAFPNKPRWHVSRWTPLTCEPSVLCHCGNHGFIRNGKWVKA